MKFGKTVIDPANPQPCSHMRNLVSSLSDGSAGGLSSWYTRLHVKGCPKCGAALEAYLAIRIELSTLDLSEKTHIEINLTPERRSNLELAMDRIEQERQGTLT